jgi:hypothetical protein
MILSNSSSVISSKGFLTLTLGVLTSTSGAPILSATAPTLLESSMSRPSATAFLAVLPDAVRRRLGGLGVHVSREDLGPEGGEAPGAGLADAAAGTDDEGRLSREVEHGAVVEQGYSSP